MKSIYVIAVAIFSILMVGCGSQPVVVDNTPLTPTNVFTADFSVQSILLPDSTGVQKVYTRSDRRRIDTNVKFDSWISRSVFGSPDRSLIGRTDQNLSWHLNNNKKTYSECGLSSCGDGDGLFDSKENSDEEYYEPFDGVCETTMSDYGLNIEPLAKGRDINGFSADQYKATWFLTMEDSAGLKDKHELVMDFWVTEPNADMKAGWEMNGQFQENLLTRVEEDEDPLIRFIGADLYKVVAAVTGDIAKDGRAGELSEIQGFPVSIKLEWLTEANTCPDVSSTAEESESIDYLDPKAALNKLAGGFLKKKVEQKFRPTFDEPIFRYIYDVTSSQIMDVRDSTFEVPENYRLIDRN